jgi:hypothetical protein
MVRRTTSQQIGQALALLCYSPATNRPVKFPDQSGHRPHDTGNLRMICCGQPLKTRTLHLVAILQKEIAVLKIWDAHNFRRTLTGLSLIAAPLVAEAILIGPCA